MEIKKPQTIATVPYIEPWKSDNDETKESYGTIDVAILNIMSKNYLVVTRYEEVFFIQKGNFLVNGMDFNAKVTFSFENQDTYFFNLPENLITDFDN